jgi:hypothetical protein
MDCEADGCIEMRNVHGIAFSRSINVPGEIVGLCVEKKGARIGRGGRIGVGNETCASHKLLAGDQVRAETGRGEAQTVLRNGEVEDRITTFDSQPVRKMVPFSACRSYP